jgi:hypothetical protein
MVNGRSNFRRQLNDALIDEWIQLQNMLSEINPTEGRDGVAWALEKPRKYSTNSLYKLMTSGDVRDIQMMLIWECNIPFKSENLSVDGSP